MSPKRLLVIVLVVFGLSVAGILAAAFFGKDASELQMEYEGFD